jgi:signal transduction histidine kinase
LPATSVRAPGGEKSTGLGLAIAKRIVEAHGGTLLLETEVSRGSTFTFLLPVEAPP